MFHGRSGRSTRWRWARGAAASALAVGLAAVALALAPIRRPRSPLEGVPTATVRRADLDPVVLAAGRVESSRSTEIRCTLERLDITGQGGGTGVGSSTILSLVPDGSTVKQGDVLCELDASDYTELVRRQKIAVKQATADQQQAALTLEVAQIELRAFREGEMVQAEQQFRGLIALARSSLTRQADRLAWTQRMLTKGYASPRQVATEELAEQRMTLDLAQQVTAFESYQRFSAPKNLLFLQSQVAGAQATFNFQSIRLKVEEGRLAHFQSQVDRCTVRAPHDGFVVHANRPGRNPEVYVGAPVRQRLRLFYLPELSQMEVGVMLHETVVDRVCAGMEAHGRVEALPGRALEGRVVSISQFPLYDRDSETGNEVKYFLGRVQLTAQPAGLRPGMTAEVKILAGSRRRVLTVPPAAVTVEDGRDVCYVAHKDRLERRPVRVGQATPDLLEVIEGLGEGEEVVLDAALVHPDLIQRSTRSL
jgi:HlyD family secretion protein